jgi:hypothetical protein
MSPGGGVDTTRMGVIVGRALLAAPAGRGVSVGR